MSNIDPKTIEQIREILLPDETWIVIEAEAEFSSMSGVQLRLTVVPENSHTRFRPGKGPVKIKLS